MAQMVLRGIEHDKKIENASNIPFVEVEMSKRLYNAIKRNLWQLFQKRDISDVYLNDFKGITRRDLLTAKSLGLASINELNEILERHNITKY